VGVCGVCGCVVCVGVCVCVVCVCLVWCVCVCVCQNTRVHACYKVHVEQYSVCSKFK